MLWTVDSVGIFEHTELPRIEMLTRFLWTVNSVGRFEDRGLPRVEMLARFLWTVDSVETLEHNQMWDRILTSKYEHSRNFRGNQVSTKQAPFRRFEGETET